MIGVGYLGRFHAQKYQLIDGVELVGVADADPKRAEQIGQELGVAGYADYRDLLDKVDLVSIATITECHFKVAEACLNAGIHVLIEKPITVTLEEADELIDIADRNNLFIQVGHLKRFHPAVAALRNSGILRSPRYIEAERLAPFKPRALDVDVVLDLMIHDVDLILNFVGSEVAKVEAMGTPVLTNQVDIANARLTFANGCIADVRASRVSLQATRKMRLFQPDAYVALDFITKGIRVVMKGEGDMQLEGVTVPALEEKRLTIEDYDTLETEIRSFCESVRDGRQPLVTGRDGRKALAVVAQVRDSLMRYIDEQGLTPPKK
ncbi:putative oxidoreductase domain-containing protein [Magnetofaba australis IT-1]|uniref:Putative oxidoreductase domain-containing protein n=1 Tax=Magnetofaba australis IT-1 TaxID=1434232 RepID=A0A1Y2K6A5_9PROT|nr:putative oxidoreductase domain-containing protein [Magnetofaba australis IT-1]